MRTAIVVAAAVLVAGEAQAIGINLYWSDCSVYGDQNRTFACGNNTSTFDLYASIDPPPGVVDAVGHSHVIDLQSASVPMPAWWDLRNTGACREFSLSAGVDFTTGTSGGAGCVNTWQGLGNASVLSYQRNFDGDPRSARLLGSIAVPTDHATVMDAGTEYYSIKFRINSQRTVGAEACSGCLDAVCLVLNQIRITQVSGPDLELCYPANSNFTTWQGGQIGHPHCPGLDTQPFCSTPTVSPTWGRVKSLYR